MKDWNIIVTTAPGQDRELLPAFNHLGDFARSEFKGILTGRVEDVGRFLEEVRRAKPGGIRMGHSGCLQ